MLKGVAAGAGYFSQYHFDAWRRIAGVEIGAVCALDRAQAEAMAAAHGIARAYDDVEAMLDAEQPDFIDIITPPASHAAIVAAAARRGIHILCQKALAPSFAEAAAIVAAAEAAGVRLMVHDNFRFQPWHREMHRLLAAGAIGRLQSIACRTRLGDGWQKDAYLSRQPYFRTMPQLLLFETGVHVIDVFRYLGGEITGVFARLRRFNPDIAGEDRGLLLCDFAGGATALWDADRYHESLASNPRYTFGEFLLEGEAGALRLQEDGTMLLHRLGEAPDENIYHPSREGFAGDSVFAALQHFVDGLRQGAPFETDGRDYLRTLAVQDAAYRSAASGRPEAV
jgi:predicted dehydrogenase